MSEERKKAFDLAKKLKALADGGVGGEKVNAAALLKKHLAKHGISEEELSASVKKYEFFKYEKNQQDLLMMIICHVVCNALILRDNKKFRNMLFLECKKEEAEKIRKIFAFYLECYRVEEKYFFQAFLHKQNLTPNIEGFAGDGQNHAGVIKAEAEDKFNVKKAPAPVQQVAYSPQEEKKIRGLMSWMPRYEMTESVIGAKRTGHDDH